MKNNTIHYILLLIIMILGANMQANTETSRIVGAEDEFSDTISFNVQNINPVVIDGPTSVNGNSTSKYDIIGYFEEQIVRVIWNIEYANSYQEIYYDRIEIKWANPANNPTAKISATVTDSRGRTYTTEPLHVKINTQEVENFLTIKENRNYYVSDNNIFKIDTNFPNVENHTIEWITSDGIIISSEGLKANVKWRKPGLKQLTAKIVGAGDEFSDTISFNVKDLPLSSVVIDGPTSVNGYSTSRYDLVGYYDDQIVEVIWDIESSHSIKPQHYDVIDINWLNPTNNPTAKITAILRNSLGEKSKAILNVKINSTENYLRINTNNNHYVDEINSYRTITNLPSFIDYNVEWIAPEGIIISDHNSFAKIIWTTTGTKKLTARIIGFGNEYGDTISINVQEKPVTQTFIIGKTVVDLGKDIKYDLKTQKESTVRTNWSITGGTIIDKDDLGVVVRWRWTNTIGGKITANVNHTDGTSYQTDLDVTIAPTKVSPYSGALSTNENYTKTVAYQVETTTGNVTADNKIETIAYFDALGRPKQSISLRAGGSKEHIINHIEYDPFGRPSKEYLPYASTNSSNAFRTQALSETRSFYNTAKYENTPNPFSETYFDGSPLNRAIKQAAPGDAWRENKMDEHSIRTSYDVYKNSDGVIQFRVDFDNQNIPNLVTVGAYTIGYVSQDESRTASLRKMITKNENWKIEDGKNNTIEEYIDYQGRTILKRTFDKGIPHETYYVYDKYENLAYVIPPKVVIEDGISATELNDLCYQYRYDNRNRLIEKKIPGKGWEYVVYNIFDQPIMTQDANLRKENTGRPGDEWLYVKYDTFGRIAYTGLAVSSASRSVLQSRANSGTFQSQWYEATTTTPTTIDNVQVYYTKKTYPISSMYLLYTVNYYDDYKFLTSDTDPEFTNPGMVLGQSVSINTKRLPTGSKVRVLDTNDWITTVTYYDQKGRPIYVASKNEYLNTTDIVETKLDFVGKVLKTKTTHTKGTNTSIVTLDEFTYDHMGRLSMQTQTINDQKPEVIIRNTYDELGQLVTKETGGGLQDVDYTYNIRGWLKGINDTNTLGNDLFGFALEYNSGANPLYNGNISKTSWQTANDNVNRSYTYTYDALNRITSGITNMQGQAYSLKNVTYDKMGNIEYLHRSGPEIHGTDFSVDIDNLYYTYDQGSKLQAVTDTAPPYGGFEDGNIEGVDYTYDENGNMIIDRNKGISKITYNHLNLPETVSISNSEGTGNISYIYDATGTKLKKIAPSGSSLITTEYAGNYIYKNGNLEFFNHPEGYIEPVIASLPGGQTGGSAAISSFDYVYQFKDHLGNIRLSYKDTDKNGAITQSEIVQEKNYYPFGLAHKGYNSTVRGGEHNYQTFQGQEINKELSLNWLSFRYRNYDSEIGRFLSIDPLAEDYIHNSTYAFAENKVISHIELEGLEGIHSSKVNAAGNRTHVIEKNVVVLTQTPRPINEGASPKKAARIQRQNARIEKSNIAKVNTVKSELKSFFSGAKNSKGEFVEFKFNVIAIKKDNTDGGSLRELIPISRENGIESGEKPFSEAPNSIAPAAIITTDGSGSSEGLTLGNIKISNNSNDEGVIAHEIGHTLMTRTKEDDYPGGDGGLMDSPPGNINSKEVDKIIEDSYEKKIYKQF